ncbi:t-SNARE, partial [Gorgonomyces haynaldii]
LPMQDRTQEFLSCVQSLRTNVHTPLLPKVSSKSEFTQAASVIAKEINQTMSKLQKLAQLAKKKSLFEDRPIEINELIYIIKQDIAKINAQIGQLSEYLGKQDPSKLQGKTKEHSHNVITSLQTKLATTSDQFKDVLQIRFENMKEQKQRREEYGYNKGTSTALANSPLYHPERRNVNQETTIDMGFQQQELLNPANAEYIESRSQAIDSIESTIAELGQIYQNFATILAGQREMVQRIDDNIMDTSLNVEGAHSQLVKYYQNMSTNRSLMFKVFGVVMVF